MRSTGFIGKKMINRWSWSIPYFCTLPPPNDVRHNFMSASVLIFCFRMVLHLHQRCHHRSCVSGRPGLVWDRRVKQYFRNAAKNLEFHVKPWFGGPVSTAASMIGSWELMVAAWAWLQGKNSSRNMPTTFLPLSFRHRAGLGAGHFRDVRSLHGAMIEPASDIVQP
jgi:hypothetical protein